MKTQSKKVSRKEVLEAVKEIRSIVPHRQLHVLGDLVRGPEGDFFASRLKELAHTFATMPRIYDQDGKGDDAVVFLHLFVGGCDWWITERDTSDEQLQAFGLVDLGHGPELGYISIDELLGTAAEIDLHWQPKTIGEIKRELAKY